MEVDKGPDSIREQQLCRMVEQYQTSLLRMCYVYLHDTALAEDAVQETFLKAYGALDAFRGESGENTWLMRIAINTCRDMLRSKWFRYVDQQVTLDDLPEPTLQPQEGDAELTMAVMQLPIKLKEIVLLYYYQDMTTTEIASALGVAQSTVSSRLKRARARLRTTLERGLSHG